MGSLTLQDEYILSSVPNEMMGSFPIIEVGCGNGDFLVEQARLHPNNIFIGCEIRLSRVRKTLSKIHRANISNAFVFPSRAEDLLNLFGPDSLGGFHMNFPDPWWKKRHHKKRFFFIQPDVDNLVEKLQKESLISFISDHKEYFYHVYSLFSYNPHLEAIWPEGFKISAGIDIGTVFSRKWEKEGRVFFQTLFKKIEL